jgi:hypothetical protein
VPADATLHAFQPRANGDRGGVGGGGEGSTGFPGPTHDPAPVLHTYEVGGGDSMSIADAVKESRVAGLRAMRDKLAADMDEAEPQVVAQVAARLQAVLKELDDLDAPGELDAFDDLARRREARIASTIDVASASGGAIPAR